MFVSSGSHSLIPQTIASTSPENLGKLSRYIRPLGDSDIATVCEPLYTGPSLLTSLGWHDRLE